MKDAMARRLVLALVLATAAAGVGAGAALWSGCGWCEGPDGTWTDVETTRGSYDGYEVLVGCADAPTDVVLRGRGDRWYQDQAPGDPGREAALNELGAEVLQTTHSLQGYFALWGEPQPGCKNERAVRLTISDWKAVDTAVARIGELLRRHKLKEEVSLRVGAVCLD